MFNKKIQFHSLFKQQQKSNLNQYVETIPKSKILVCFTNNYN